MEIVIHKIYEPGIVPESSRERRERVVELIPLISAWVCIGPFDDSDFYHAEDHPNAIAICRNAPREIGSEVVDGLARLLDKLGEKYEITEYPGD
ncbi:MAG TPA: hypothetical protein VGN42_25000 [Pirellulales bacterium]|jgi:hypothetical protein|nr:hypothetical protein [Pirellulales bacterium]